MSIRIKITVMFLAVVMIPLLVVSALTFMNYKNSIEAARLTELQNIASFKADKIEAYFAGLKTCAQIAQSGYLVKKYFPVLSNFAHDQANPEFQTAREIVSRTSQKIKAVMNVSDIMLVDPDGRVICANNPRHYAKNMSSGMEAEQKAFINGKEKIFLSDIYFDKEEDKRFEMLVTAPAFDLNNTFVGVIALEVDMDHMYRLVQDVTGLGKTGETLLGKKTGTEVLFLNPLRYDPDAALKRRVTLGDKNAIGIQSAVQGKIGAGQFIDYRGKDVVGAWRYIPSLDFGMVAKIDVEEAFADVAKLRNLVGIILIIICILACVMAFSIARSISGPINKLSQGVEIIGRGNLDHTVGTAQQDEIGQLSRSFDKMVQDLKKTTASRDELNREIGERKKAEAELRESEQRLSQAIGVGELGSWGLDTRSGKAWRSLRHDQIFGYPELLPEWTYERFIDHVLPEDRKQVDEKYGQSLANGTEWSFECRIRRSDGAIRWIWGQGKPRHNDRNEVVQLIGLVQDITNRKQIEEALRATNEELTSLNKVMVGRELRMIELKKEINDLCDRVGQQRRYTLDFDKGQP